jgi:bacterioferritin
MHLLAQNIQGERCAIEVYGKLLNMVAGKDPITEHLVREILEDELEHEQDLEDLHNSCNAGAKTCDAKPKAARK